MLEYDAGREICRQWHPVILFVLDRDEFGRRLTQVVMMDAIKLQKTFEQFSEKLVCRELTKVEQILMLHQSKLTEATRKSDICTSTESDFRICMYNKCFWF